jgi:hypothetical protein
MPLFYVLLGLIAAWSLKDQLSKLGAKIGDLKLLPPKGQTLMDESKNLDNKAIREGIQTDAKNKAEKSAFADARISELKKKGVSATKSEGGAVLPTAQERSEDDEKAIYSKWVADNMARNKK